MLRKFTDRQTFHNRTQIIFPRAIIKLKGNFCRQYFSDTNHETNLTTSKLKFAENLINIIADLSLEKIWILLKAIHKIRLETFPDFQSQKLLCFPLNSFSIEENEDRSKVKLAIRRPREKSCWIVIYFFTSRFCVADSMLANFHSGSCTRQTFLETFSHRISKGRRVLIFGSLWFFNNFSFPGFAFWVSVRLGFESDQEIYYTKWPQAVCSTKKSVLRAKSTVPWSLKLETKSGRRFRMLFLIMNFDWS